MRLFHYVDIHSEQYAIMSLQRQEKNMETIAKKVLLVEDDETLSTLLSDHLRKEGFEVDVATDGEKGLQKILSEKPSVVLLDIAMPKKDGMTLLREFRSEHPEDSTPIIVLTNSSNIQNIAMAMQNKAVAYLIKSDQSMRSIVEMVKQRVGVE